MSNKNKKVRNRPRRGNLFNNGGQSSIWNPSGGGNNVQSNNQSWLTQYFPSQVDSFQSNDNDIYSKMMSNTLLNSNDKNLVQMYDSNWNTQQGVNNMNDFFNRFLGKDSEGSKGTNWGSVAAQGVGFLGDMFNNTQVESIQRNDMSASTKEGLMHKASQFKGYNANEANEGKAGLKGLSQGAAIGTKISPGWGTLIGGVVGGLAGLITSGSGNRKRRRKVREANRKTMQEIQTQNTLINQQNIRESLANQYKYGGILGATSLVEKQLALNGNNIFAYGGNFSNGVNKFNTGGSHEENPLGGIMQGIGENGEPNLVEENEVKWNDYIFSDRLYVDDIYDDDLLPSQIKGMSFAEAAEYLQEESVERENDPISKRGLEDSLSKLAMLQETIKEEEMAKQMEEEGLGEEFYDEGLGEEYNEEPIEDSMMGMEEPMGEMFKYGGIMPNMFNKGGKLGQRYRERRDAYSNLTEKERDIEDIRRADIMRRMPLLSNAGLTFDAIFSKADTINLDRVAPGRLTQKMTYKPIDNEYIANQMRQQAAATNSALLSSSGGNRAIAQAALLAANRSSQEAIGQAMLEGDEYNEKKRQQALDFNRATDQFNLQQDFQAQQVNAEKQMKEAEYYNQSQAARRNAIREGFANIGKTIGDIGTENRWMGVSKITSGGYDSSGIYHPNYHGDKKKDNEKESNQAYGGIMKIYKKKIK